MKRNRRKHILSWKFWRGNWEESRMGRNIWGSRKPGSFLSNSSQDSWMITQALSNSVGLFCVQQNMKLSLSSAENKAVSATDTHSTGIAALTGQCWRYGWQPVSI